MQGSTSPPYSSGSPNLISPFAGTSGFPNQDLGSSPNAHHLTHSQSIPTHIHPRGFKSKRRRRMRYKKSLTEREINNQIKVSSQYLSPKLQTSLIKHHYQKLLRQGAFSGRTTREKNKEMDDWIKKPYKYRNLTYY